MGFEKLAEPLIQEDLKFDDDFMFKYITAAKAFTFIAKHVHSFKHTTQLPCGAVRVWLGHIVITPNGIEGEFTDYQGPALIVVPAGVEHTFMTLVDNTILVCTNRLDEHGEVPILREHHLVSPV